MSLVCLRNNEEVRVAEKSRQERGQWEMRTVIFGWGWSKLHGTLQVLQIRLILLSPSRGKPEEECCAKGVLCSGYSEKSQNEQGKGRIRETNQETIATVQGRKVFGQGGAAVKVNCKTQVELQELLMDMRYESQQCAKGLGLRKHILNTLPGIIVSMCQQKHH